MDRIVAAMWRGVRVYLVGALVLVALAGCGRKWFAEREPWRREAEVACLKSGSVKETPGRVRISPIEGPGVCGADFPIKVSALGESRMLGFADLRPSAGIPGAQPPYPLRPPSGPVTSAPLGQPAPGAPMQLTPPNAAAPNGVTLGAPPSFLSHPQRNAAPMGQAVQPVMPPRNTAMPVGDDLPDDLVPPPSQSASQARSARPHPPMPQFNPARATPVVPMGRAPMTTGAITPAQVTPAATLACPMVSALENWVTTAIQPSAMRWFGQPVVEIKQISAYSCRGMNGNRSSRISEHAFGNALDISAFVLADGRKVTFLRGWHASPEEQGFLHDVQLAACQSFATVLAPGSNRYHDDHIHVDLMRRASARSICQPEAIPGEVVAARAAQKGYAARRDPGITGSIGTTAKKAEKKKTLPVFTRRVREEDEEDDHGEIDGEPEGDSKDE